MTTNSEFAHRVGVRRVLWSAALLLAGVSAAAVPVDGEPTADASPVATAVAAPAPAAQGTEAAATGDDALAELLRRGPESEARAERCIRNSSIESTNVLNGHLIVFEMGRDDYYINQMPVNCPGLKPRAKVAYTSRGDGRLCQLDTIQVLMPAGIGVGGDNMMVGPSCMLGKFEPITRDQLDVLKERYTPDGKDPLETLFETIF